MYSNMYSNMYISWWVYFVTDLSYVLQQPATAGPAKTKTNIAKKSSHSYSSCWLNPTYVHFAEYKEQTCIHSYLKIIYKHWLYFGSWWQLLFLTWKALHASSTFTATRRLWRLITLLQSRINELNYNRKWNLF